MPICKKCTEPFPNRVMIAGVQRVLNRRKYCLECSPFGGHNTRRLEAALHQNGERTCKRCNRPYGGKRRRMCSSCYNAERRARMSEKVHSIVGYKCWYCGYGDRKRRPLLNFHHVDSEEKALPLNISNIATYKWTRILAEMQKCALLCNRCHGELHAGVLQETKVRKIYRAKWKVINEG